VVCSVLDLDVTDICKKGYRFSGFSDEKTEPKPVGLTWFRFRSGLNFLVFQNFILIIFFNKNQTKPKILAKTDMRESGLFSWLFNPQVWYFENYIYKKKIFLPMVWILLKKKDFYYELIWNNFVIIVFIKKNLFWFNKTTFWLVYKLICVNWYNR
jgi:hypothetical protein